MSSIFCLLERGEGGGGCGGVSVSCVEVVGGDEYHDLVAGCAPGPIKQMMQRQEKERQRQQQQATKGRRLGAGGAPNGPLMIRCSSINASASSRRDSSLVGSRAALFDRNASMARSSAYDWGAPPHRALSIKRGPGVGGEVASSTRASKTLQVWGCEGRRWALRVTVSVRRRQPLACARESREGGLTILKPQRTHMQYG